MQAGEDRGPEATVYHPKIQTQRGDDGNHARVGLVGPPQGTRQTVLAALVEPLEILWHAEPLKSVHVEEHLPLQ